MFEIVMECPRCHEHVRTVVTIEASLIQDDTGQHLSPCLVRTPDPDVKHECKP